MATPIWSESMLNEIEFFTDYIADWKGLKKIFAVKREIEKKWK